MNKKTIKNKNFKIISVEGNIGSGKTTATKMIKDILSRTNSKSYKLLLETINNNSKSYGSDIQFEKITSSFFDERTAVSPFLLDFYDIMSLAELTKNKSKKQLRSLLSEKYDLKNKKELNKHISQVTSNLEAIFFLDMLKPLRSLIDTINSLEEKEFRIIIMDRTALSVIKFTKFYIEQGFINKKDFKWLNKIFLNNKELLSILLDSTMTEQLFIDIDVNLGFDNVRERNRESEKTMSFDYYLSLYNFYEREMKPQHDKSIIQNIHSKEDFRENLFNFLLSIDYINE